MANGGDTGPNGAVRVIVLEELKDGTTHVEVVSIKCHNDGQVRQIGMAALAATQAVKAKYNP